MNDISFKVAFREAVGLAENSTHVVVIYSKTRGEISDIYATCLKRSKIELIGSHVDKLDRVFKRKNRILDSYNLEKLVETLSKLSKRKRNNLIDGYSEIKGDLPFVLKVCIRLSLGLPALNHCAAVMLHQSVKVMIQLLPNPC